MPSVSPASPPPTIVMGFVVAIFYPVRCAMNKWLNGPAGCSVNRQFGLSGQSAESSLPENPARTLTTASCRVTRLQPMAHSSRLQSKGQAGAARFDGDEQVCAISNGTEQSRPGSRRENDAETNWR